MHILFIFLIIALVALPWSKILRRTGFSPWLAVLIFIPFVNIAFLWWFAQAKWQHNEPSA